MKLKTHPGIFIGIMLAMLSPATGFAQNAASTVPAPNHGGQHLPGKFIWADLVTDDTTAAKRFYQSMFGWSFSGDEKHLIATRRGQPVAGIVHRERPANRPGATPRWIPYMSVADVDQSLRRATAAGGRTLAAPRDFPGRARKAALTDPEGAAFGLIRTVNGDPADALADTGEWIWLQLVSKDARKASGFYQRIGGYEIHEDKAENRASDFVLASNGHARATVRTIPRGRGDVRPVWLPFVRVDNVARAQSRAVRLGGKVLVASRADLMDGRIAVVSDPTGAAIGIMQWKP